MTGPIRGFVTFVVLAALACALTACDGSVGATPNPAPSQSASPSTSAGQTDTPLAGISACTTLDKALGGKGFPPGQPSAAAPQHGCLSTKPQFGSAGLDLQDSRNYKAAVYDPSKTSTGQVGNRDAVLERDLQGAEGWAVYIEVRPNSRATLTMAMYRSTTDDACKQVRALAEAVDPLLPSNG
ncbi:hypothetical protein ABZU76_30145 [Amycolatopsis sp. NPDC005232]|uniref:hypothetical protein n=1 Tax=Amycolatopsis sp. NPDC005232 TaxID=3157027 RepID=UPI0033A4B64D